MRTDFFGRLRRFGALVAVLGVTSSCTTLPRYVRDGDHAGVARALRSGANPNYVKTGEEEDYWTPLFLAIGQHDLELVKLLVEGGADINLPSMCEGSVLTPVMKAAVHGDVVIVRYLLEKGADPTVITKDTDLLQWLVLRRDRATVVERKAIARVVLRHLRTTAGKEAAQAFLDTQTGDGWTPLTLAIWQNDAVMFELFLSEGAAINAFASVNDKAIRGVTSDEWTPMFLALWLERSDMVKQLIRAGASPEERTASGKSLAEVRAEVAEYRRKQAEEEAELAELQRQNELEERREQRRTGLAFYEKFVHQTIGAATANYEASQGRPARTTISNPVDDNSFQDQMRAIYEAGLERKKREAEQQQHGAAAAASPGRAAGAESSPHAADEDRGQERERAEAEAKERSRQERERAEAEAKERWKEHLAAVRRGIQLRATKGPRCDAGEYCVVAKWPADVRWRGDGEGGLVDVDFRARCPGSSTWSSGTIWGLTDNRGAYVSPTLSPKPSCPVDDIEVEATAVRGAR